MADRGHGGSATHRGGKKKGVATGGGGGHRIRSYEELCLQPPTTPFGNRTLNDLAFLGTISKHTTVGNVRRRWLQKVSSRVQDGDAYYFSLDVSKERFPTCEELSTLPTPVQNTVRATALAILHFRLSPVILMAQRRKTKAKLLAAALAHTEVGAPPSIPFLQSLPSFSRWEDLSGVQKCFFPRIYVADEVIIHEGEKETACLQILTFGCVTPINNGASASARSASSPGVAGGVAVGGAIPSSEGPAGESSQKRRSSDREEGESSACMADDGGGTAGKGNRSRRESVAPVSSIASQSQASNSWVIGPSVIGQITVHSQHRQTASWQCVSADAVVWSLNYRDYQRLLHKQSAEVYRTHIEQANFFREHQMVAAFERHELREKFLRSFAEFNVLPVGLAKQVVPKFVAKVYRPGAHVYGFNELADSLLYLVSGTVCLSKSTAAGKSLHHAASLAGGRGGGARLPPMHHHPHPLSHQQQSAQQQRPSLLQHGGESVSVPNFGEYLRRRSGASITPSQTPGQSALNPPFPSGRQHQPQAQAADSSTTTTPPHRLGVPKQKKLISASLTPSHQHIHGPSFVGVGEEGGDDYGGDAEQRTMMAAALMASSVPGSRLVVGPSTLGDLSWLQSTRRKFHCYAVTTCDVLILTKESMKMVLSSVPADELLHRQAAQAFNSMSDEEVKYLRRRSATAPPGMMSVSASKGGDSGSAHQDGATNKSFAVGGGSAEDAQQQQSKLKLLVSQDDYLKYVPVIRTIPLLSRLLPVDTDEALPSAVVKELAASCRSKVYAPKATITSTTQVVDRIFFIISGRAIVSDPSADPAKKLGEFRRQVAAQERRVQEAQETKKKKAASATAEQHHSLPQFSLPGGHQTVSSPTTQGEEGKTKLAHNECLGFPVLEAHKWYHRIVAVDPVECVEIPYDRYLHITKKYGYYATVLALSRALLHPMEERDLELVAKSERLVAHLKNPPMYSRAIRDPAEPVLCRVPTEASLSRLPPIPVQQRLRTMTSMSGSSMSRVNRTVHLSPTTPGGSGSGSPGGGQQGRGGGAEEIQPIILGKHVPQHMYYKGRSNSGSKKKKAISP